MTYEEARNRFLDCAYSSGLTTPVHEEMVTMVIEALEKQIPKKPIRTNDTSEYCPSCTINCEGDNLLQLVGFAGRIMFYRCPHCGQAIDWSETE